MKRIALWLIRSYQAAKPLRTFVSKIFFLPESTCRFRPTCSEYMYQAVEKYGAIKGGFMGIKRIIKCNPLSRPTYDPVQ
jgi:putative membrane protein insertion efficiency factor